MTQPNELRRIREGCAKLLGYTISKREPNLSASDGRKYYYQGQIHYWMDDCGPQRDYWNPLEENSPHALEVLKWCVGRISKNHHRVAIYYSELKQQWQVGCYLVEAEGETFEIAVCKLALKLSKLL